MAPASALLILLFTLEIITTTCTFFDCRTKRCRYEALMCDDNEACFVDCGYDIGDVTEACQDALIYCPTNATCAVTCDAKESCDNTFIVATHSTQLNLTCSGYPESCWATKVFCPNRGNCTIEGNNTNINFNIFKYMEIYAVYGLNNMYLSAPAQLATDVTVECGSNYEYLCELSPDAPHKTCQGPDPLLCSDLTDLNESSVILPNNQFNCEESRACGYDTFRCIDNIRCDVICTDYKSCQHSQIYCPANATCAVQCDASQACYDMTIYAAHSSILDVTCFDHARSCMSMFIICPSEAKSCVITAYNDANPYTALNRLDINAINGSDALIFTHSAPLASDIVIRFYCGWDYESMCSLPTANPSQSPTQVPSTATAQPTSPPTSATAQPTSATAQPTSATTQPTSATAPPTSATAQPTSGPITSGDTVSVTVHVCDTCDINTDVITQIVLIAFDDKATILSADVIDDNELLVVLSVQTLDSDIVVIEKEIEERLKDDYGDVQVDIEGDSDQEDQDEDAMDWIRQFVTDHVWELVISLSLASCCCIACVYWFHRWRGAKRMTKVEAQLSVSGGALSDEVVPSPGCSKEMVDTVDDHGEEEDATGEASMSEQKESEENDGNSTDEDMYTNDNAHTTTGGADMNATTGGADMNTTTGGSDMNTIEMNTINN